ncbi:MAG: hypothetical protein LBC51_04740, partial [Treponema sp.]|nr:hypothetical protein [Treponema sp.]
MVGVAGSSVIPLRAGVAATVTSPLLLLVFRHDCNCGMTCFIMGDIETKGEGIYATEEIQGNTHEG